MNIELNIAASENNLEAVKNLYKEGDQLYIALAMAAQNGHNLTLQYLLTLETTPQDRENGLAEGLFYASQNGHSDVVDFLLASKAPLKRTGHGNSRTALHAAAGKGHNDIVLKLLNAGIKVNVLNDDKCSPLFEAVGAKRTETVKLLLEKGANPVQKDRFGLTPEAMALQYGPEDIIILIKDALAKKVVKIRN